LDYIKSAANGSYKQYIIHELTLDTLAIKTYEESNSLSRVVPLAGFGSSFKISKRTSVYTNFCMNYRAVNFSDIRVVNPNVIVDSAIRDEYGSTTELGWRGFLGKYFYVDVAGFYIFYGNKIGIAPYEAKKIRTNIGDARNMGVEFFTEFDILKMVSDSSKCGLSTFINFSYINSKYIRSREANYVGNSVEYVSPVILRSGIKFRTEKFQVQVQGSYNAEQYSDASNAYIPSGDAVIGIVPEYFVFDLSTRYTINKNFQVEGGINNLTNEIYFSRRASDGRYFYLTLQFRCNTK
jgi:Fe(3+) dicitrate transport protein